MDTVIVLAKFEVRILTRQTTCDLNTALCTK